MLYSLYVALSAHFCIQTDTQICTVCTVVLPINKLVIHKLNCIHSLNISHKLDLKKHFQNEFHEYVI